MEKKNHRVISVLLFRILYQQMSEKDRVRFFIQEKFRKKKKYEILEHSNIKKKLSIFKVLIVLN